MIQQRHKVIKEVLMCNPLHYSVDYIINPWMKPNSVNKDVARVQWEDLRNVYTTLGIKVNIVDQIKGLPDMVYTTDCGIVKGKNVLLSNFRHPERQPEIKAYRKWFEEKGYTIKEVPNHHYLEGNGEVYFWNDYIFVGTGVRSDPEIPKFLEKTYDREVVYLKIMDPLFFHLDVGFLPLNADVVFYYPSAYSPGTIKELKKRIPNLIEFTKEEALGFAGNSVVTDHHVIVQKDNPSFEGKLKSLGYTPIPVDVSEFIKGGGGAHCLTNILEEN